MHDYFLKNSVTYLRWALGVVYLWFGLLKFFDVSPVTQMIATTYPFLPQDFFIPLLAVWEIAIGLGLIFKTLPKLIFPLLWLQLMGTFSTFLFNPPLFFNDNNPLLLTFEGEFVMKNIVLVTASLVIVKKILEEKKQPV